MELIFHLLKILDIRYYVAGANWSLTNQSETILSNRHIFVSHSF